MESVIVRFGNCLQRICGLSQYRYLLAVLLLNAAAFPSLAATDELDAEIASAVIRLQDRVVADNAVPMQLIDAVNTHITELRRNLIDVAGGRPQQYDVMFRYYGKELARAAAVADPQEVRAIISEVDEDVRLKDRFLRESLGATASRSPFVTVSISTYKDGKIAYGYWVRLNPKSRTDFSDALFPFNHPTPYAVEELPPGRYVIGVYRDTELVVTQPAPVGLDGKRTVSISVAVPR